MASADTWVTSVPTRERMARHRRSDRIKNPTKCIGIRGSILFRSGKPKWSGLFRFLSG